MKTNQTMTVSILDGELPVEHKTYFGSLQALFQIGNRWRAMNGLPVLRPEQWLNMRSTQEFIREVEERIGTQAVKRRRGGRGGGGSWAHLYVLLDAAAYLSPALKLDIYEKFVQGRLLEWRDRSGDNFIELNAAIAMNAEEVFGKPAHRGHYINIANALKRRCGVDNWNRADHRQLQERARIEEALATMLRAGVVRDWDHLKELAEIV